MNVGTPSLLIRIANKGPRDPNGNVWIDLQLTNTGTGHARNVSLTSLTLLRLNGIGTVTYDAARSGPLPLATGWLDVGETRTVRPYVNVPLTVTRFSITEGVTSQNVIGTTLTLWDADPFAGGVVVSEAPMQTAAYSATVSTVPEPGILLLMGAGAGISALVRRRRRSSM